MTIRVGFLGTGFIARTHRWFLEHASVDHRIVAVHDPDTERARTFADRVGADAVAEEALLDVVDAVFVTTWTSEHERLVAAAAERGAAVFCEKPLALDAASAQRMVDAVEASGAVDQVGLILRFIPQFLLARRLVRDPRAGRVLAVSFRDDQFIPIQGHYGSDWRVDPARCGRGTLLEHSIHDVDVLQWLCGPVHSVTGALREVHGHRGIDDVAVARIEFDSGALASLTSIWHDIVDRPSQRHVEVFCDDLYVRMDGEPHGSITWQYTGEPQQELTGADVAHDCIEHADASAADLVAVPGGAMFNPVNAFLGAIVTGGPAPLPLRAALPAHRIVDAIYASADRSGAVVRL
jgi:predicted dehydrogenase